MNKYVVDVLISKFDENSKSNGESIEYTFDSGNLIEDRKNAIKKAKELIISFDKKLIDGKPFSSFEEAQCLGFKNFNCYSISIYLKNEDGESPIYGTGDDEQYDWLEYEANIFREEYPNMEFVQIENPAGDLIDVIETDLYFLLYSSLIDF